MIEGSGFFVGLLFLDGLGESLNLVAVVSEGLDQERHDEIGHLGAPSELKGNIRSDEIIAGIQSSSEAIGAVLINKVTEELFGEFLVSTVGSTLDGILPEVVALGKRQGLLPHVVGLVDVSGDTTELQKIVILNGASKRFGIKGLEGGDGSSEGFEILFLDVASVKGLIHLREIDFLNQLEIRLDERHNLKVLGNADDLGLVNLVLDDAKKINSQERVLFDVEADGLVDLVGVFDLGDDFLELGVVKGIGRVSGHGAESRFQVIRVDIQEGGLSPLQILFADTDDLGIVEFGVVKS